MTAEQYVDDVKAPAARRDLARRLLMSEDEYRAHRVAEDEDLREQAETDRAEVRPVIP